MSADFPVTTTEFAPVTWPEVHCVVQVHDAPIWVTFKPSPTGTRGIKIQPGVVFELSGDEVAFFARKGDYAPALLVFEEFG